MSRPEDISPPEVYYNDSEAAKYTTNSRIIEVQSQMAERAVELLGLQESGALVLDLGCGSGLSGEVLTENGHYWVGLDISKAMLEIAQEREVAGDTLLCDLGQGFGFLPGSFDGAISVSAIQWLCNADKTSHNPYRRLAKFFKSLNEALKRGARAVLQFYPSHPQQIEMITHAAVKSGFMTDLLIDFPNSTKAKKHYLILYNGTSGTYTRPEPVLDEDKVKVSKQARHKKAGDQPRVKSRTWVQQKKDRQRRQGKNVRPDSKYSGRKRHPQF